MPRSAPLCRGRKMARNDAVADVTGALFDEGWTKSAGGRGEQSKPRGGGRGSRFGRQQQMARAASGNRAIVVKMVRGGGCVNSRQLGNQLEYVTGKADVVIESTGTLEREGSLAPSELREVVDRWSDSWKTAPKTGHTAHLIVSFPPETDARAVQGITQRFCEEMFEGKYDFVAATHSDRHHPHAHIVVNRHSEDHGLFTLRAGTEHSYENYKQVIAELGRYHGVDLEASTRLERGHVHRAPTDADYRNGLRAERPRTGADLAYAQGVIAKHAQTYSTLAALARGISAVDHTGFRGMGSVTHTRLDGLAENLDRAAADLAVGRPVIPANYSDLPVAQQERFHDTLDWIGDVLDEAKSKMQQATPVERVALEVRLNQAELLTSNILPASDRNAQLSRPASEFGIYAPDNAKVAQAHIAENGDAAIRAAVKDTGLDADVVIARLKEGAPTAALEERWLLDDARSIAGHRGFDLTKLADREAALDALNSIHDNVSDAVGMEFADEETEAVQTRAPVSSAGRDTGTGKAALTRTTKAISYAQGVRGEVLDHGAAPYKNYRDEPDSYFVRLRLEDGRTHDVWGVGLSELVRDNRLKVGDTVTLTATGVEYVTTTERDRLTGEMVEHESPRRVWEAGDIERGVVAETPLAVATTGVPLRAPKSDLARMPTPADAEDAAEYKQAVEDRLTPDELARLKQGDISALAGAGAHSDQLRIAHDYLRADGQSPEALKQVSQAYIEDLSARRAQDRGIEH